jgi:hypothetical protein
VPDGFYRIVLDWAVGGIEVRGGRVTDEVAPIFEWMKGKTALTVHRWVKGKGGSMELVATQGSML